MTLGAGRAGALAMGVFVACAAGCGSSEAAIEGDGLPTFRIAGVVFGDASAGVTIALSGRSSASTTTGSDGAYSFVGLANGSYTVTPSLTGYTFTPPSFTVTVNGSDVAGREFSARIVPAPTYAISGTVSGDASAGVTIALSGPSSASTTTGSDGAYSFVGLANGSYTVTPSLTGYTFTPPSLTVTVNGADVAGTSFTTTVDAGTYTVSGVVAGDTASAGLLLDGATSTVAFTGTDGRYSFDRLASGLYTLTPSSLGYTFDPPSLTVRVNGTSVVDADFTAKVALRHTISGTVYGVPSVICVGRVCFAGPSVRVSGTIGTGFVRAQDAPIDASGRYSLSGLIAGNSVTLWLECPGYVFDPPSRQVTMRDADVTGLDFTAIPAP